MTSASFSSSSIRSFGVLSRHVCQAFSAAATARSTSSSPARGTSAITSPVAGFSTSMVSPERASTNSPSTNIFCWVTATLIWPSTSYSGFDTRSLRVLATGLRHT
jgi:hypothetical protein